MQRPSRKDIASYSKKNLVELTNHLLDEMDYAVFQINHLEKQLEVALNELGSKNQRVLEIVEQIDDLKKKVFGRSSEKTNNEPDIFSQDKGDISKSEEEEKKRSNRKKGSKKAKRKKAIEKVSSDTKINEIFHYATDSEIATLGLIAWSDQFETSDLITVVPTTIQIDRHHRQKYHYSDNLSGERKFFTAGGPIKLREGAQYSIEFVSNVTAYKYCYHLPIDRQVTMLKSKGLEITASSLFNQMDYAAFILKKPVFDEITNHLESSPIVEADDTTWPNLEDLKTRTQDKYYLWGMKNNQAVAFNIYNARSQKSAKNFLGKQEGILLSDAHNSFEGLVSAKLILASDWAHTRRHFVNAESNYAEECRPILRLINKLFSLEKEFKGKPPDVIVKERREKSIPVLDEIRHLLDTTGHLKTSSLGKAIRYADRLWERLVVFVNHGELPISTNGIERSMRTPAVGRKNHLGSKNMATAKNAAIWYTIVETCKLNSVAPEAYIDYALKTTLSGNKPLLPWEYSAK